MRQQDRNQAEEKTVRLIEGNTVKQMQAAPNRHGEEVHRELEEKKRREREEEERRRKQEKEARARKRKQKAVARKNQEKALRMSSGYLLFVAIAIIALVGVTMGYLQLRSELTRNTKRVAALEREVLDLKTNNEAKQQKIDASVDLESIRQKAMGELGMVYPSEGQIEYFKMEDSDYMHQYDEIP